MNIFSLRNNYWKNGTQWMGRIGAKLIGEPRYEWFRLTKRTTYAEYFMTKQSIYYWGFIHMPDWCMNLSIMHKVDSSHGFPWQNPMERIGDVSEMNFNQDGWKEVYVFLAGAWILWYATTYYLYPLLWVKPNENSGEEDRLRLRDAHTSVTYEHFWAHNIVEWMCLPHEFNQIRKHHNFSYSPDDPRMRFVRNFNRKNKYSDHHFKGFGESTTMVTP
eukprot:CAMPEP_0114973110 /NCGR_PEP_ID=MMETSP0216-20121206/774_1 /TAXON_ID=223996 /ORGANISM="Protocruzia adherens, Strain Boccale" /LENGTH=216 /DNA_ID=CAMNT_0002333569 /DNA_START=82 /DNA_END=732 /DNA_ORIENTATION=+